MPSSTGDDRRAAEFLERALKHTDELWVRQARADALLATGTLSSALPEIERLSRENPGDDSAQLLYREAIRSVWERHSLASDADSLRERQCSRGLLSAGGGRGARGVRRPPGL